MDAYSLRSFALYLDDGTLFAVYGQADPILQKTAGAVMLLAFDVTLADIAAPQIAFGNTDFLDPPATTDTAGVVELATDDEAVAGADARRAITPHGLAVAIGPKLNRAGDTVDGDLVVRKTLGVRNATGDQLMLIMQGDRNGVLYMQPVAGAQFPLFANSVGDQSVAFFVTPRVGGSPIWHAGNDGAGSGLDADLVDGRDGAWFADIAARLGYTPVNRAGDTVTGDMTFLSTTALQNALGDRFMSVMQADRNAVLYLKSGGGGQVALLSAQAGSPVMTFATGPLVAGNVVWHAANDGAGSGLDADLLDGRDGSWYADILARLGFTPVNRAGDTIQGDLAVTRTIAAQNDTGDRLMLLMQGDRTGVLYMQPVAGAQFPLLASRVGDQAVAFYVTPKVAANSIWHAGNDGAGSGLDADLLDGRDSSWFADIVARLGFTPVNRAGDTVQGDLTALGSVAAQNATGDRLSLAMQGDRNAVLYLAPAGGAGVPLFGVKAGTGSIGFNATPTVAGNADWHAGNDGAGSGLDADLLDGHDSSEFLLKADLPNSAAGNGWQQLPGGLIMQWGRAAVANGNIVTAEFPIPFPNACFTVQATNEIGDSNAPPTSWPGIGRIGKTSCDIISASSSGTAVNGFGVKWFAIGN